MKKLAYEPESMMKPVFEAKDLQKLEKSFDQRHTSFLNQEYFTLSCFYNSDQIQIKITLQNRAQTMVYPIEAVCIRQSLDESLVQKQAILMLDYLESYFLDYFTQDRDVYFPIDWSLHQWENLSFYVRGFVRNLKLEQMADALLNEFGHGQYHVESISEENKK